MRLTGWLSRLKRPQVYPMMPACSRWRRALLWIGFVLPGMGVMTVSVADEHDKWSALLQSHVRVIDGGVATQVDYAGFARDRADLQTYLAQLSQVTRADFDQRPLADQLAFLINAYNAWTVELILGAWPDLASIRDLGSFLRTPWQRAFIPLLGDTVSLDNIEHDMIRGWDRYNEPRIHFAVNCASIGCPALRHEAFRAQDLDAQLDEQTRLFLSDRSRNYLQDNTLWVTPILRWYADDFERGWAGYQSVPAFLADYAEALGLSEAQRADLLAGRIRLRYLDYDWALNGIRD